MSILIFLFGVLAWGAPDGAEHPVPLPADFDAAKCVECHTSQQEGKFVHTAVSLGCASCHTVETKEEKTMIGLVAEPAELCATCHEVAKAPALHAPYEQKRCIVCHDPHTSNFKAQTRAATNTLCLNCHGERAVTGETVELIHSEKIPAEQFRQIPKLMLDKNQRIGHPFLLHPVGGRPDPLRKGEDFSCLSCHNPHAAPLPRLLSAAWKGLDVCDQCHAAAKAGKEKDKP